MEIMCNYQGFCGCHLILVFDAYKVKGNPGSVEQFHNISVVYTKEAETADMYIEKTTKEIARKKRVRVATSDGMEPDHHTRAWGDKNFCPCFSGRSKTCQRPHCRRG